MSNESRETVADIVAEMRNGPCCLLTPAGIPQHSHDNYLFYKFADRIEAAVEFTLAVETAKAAGEGFAAEEQSAKERSCKLGNAAAMREALEALVGVIDECNSGNPLWWHIGAKGVKPLKDARASLAAPPMNCDVGTVDEQSERFHSFCESNKQCGDVYSCERCQLNSIEDCELAWSQMPYKEGGME